MSLQTHCLQVVAAKLQMMIGATTFADLDVAEATVGQLADELPSGPTQRERPVLRGLLFDFASLGGKTLHERVHRRSRRDECKFTDGALAVQFLGDVSADPCLAFRQWGRSFFSELCRHHPSSAARQAARLLQRAFRVPLNVTALARQVHTTPSQLRQGFRGEFGMHLREYVAAVRLVAALERVTCEKAEATALEVGYRSKKNFYRLFRQLTGLTPTAFRLLPEDQRRALVDGARDRLKWQARISRD